MPVAAIVGAAAIVGGATYMASKSQSRALERGSRAQAEASDRAIALQREMWEKGLELGQPFYDVGLGALPDLEKAIRGGYDYKPSPIAEYSLQTGGRALMRSLGARGLAGSGLAPYKLGELTSAVYASDYDKQIARLSGLVDIGRGQASDLSQLGQQYGQSAGNIYISAGENQANAALTAGRGLASLYQGLGQLPMNLASLYIMGGGSFGSSPSIPRTYQT